MNANNMAEQINTGCYTPEDIEQVNCKHNENDYWQKVDYIIKKLKYNLVRNDRERNQQFIDKNTKLKLSSLGHNITTLACKMVQTKKINSDGFEGFVDDTIKWAVEEILVGSSNNLKEKE
jgi:hypothetical protein